MGFYQNSIIPKGAEVLIFTEAFALLNDYTINADGRVDEAITLMALKPLKA